MEQICKNLKSEISAEDTTSGTDQIFTLIFIVPYQARLKCVYQRLIFTVFQYYVRSIRMKAGENSPTLDAM
uniref:Uncharacterized protein n=1 Tax=Onchocerca volvulus TaxID=6282 RepID=A0A8R1TSW4_ONCVO